MLQPPDDFAHESMFVAFRSGIIGKLFGETNVIRSHADNDDGVDVAFLSDEVESFSQCVRFYEFHIKAHFDTIPSLQASQLLLDIAFYVLTV